MRIPNPYFKGFLNCLCPTCVLLSTPYVLLCPLIYF
nr:MAG TPA: hypothetical protein [Caudoviricetes sp.]